MATESVATTQSNHCELWECVNQLESVLEIANESLCRYFEVDTPEDKKAEFNRAHNMVRLAQKLGQELAESTGVR